LIKSIHYKYFIEYSQELGYNFFMTKKTAVDSKIAGVRNEKIVLELLRDNGALSQAQICAKTGLRSSTISYIVGRLREKDLIIERAGKSSKRGAKPVLMDLNPAGIFFIGTEVNSSYLMTGLFDFNSDLVDHVEVSLDSDRSVDHVVHLLEVSIMGLLSKNGIEMAKLGGIGVTLSGSISPEGRVQLSSSLGWKNVPLKKLLTSKFDCLINIYTTKVRLLAEMNIQSSLSSKNIVYFNIANGVGLTVVSDGNLLNGATNRCGELGHVVVDPDGPLCGCGQRGCLETLISGPSLAGKMKADLGAGTSSVLSDLISEQDMPERILEQLKQAITLDDSYALTVRDFIAEHISRSAATAINLFDPDLLILGGYVSETCIDYFIEQIKKEMAGYVYDESSRTIGIVHARAGRQSMMRGVAAAVLHELFTTE
jgi:predicted NBD/HSP70 family sugar kinase